METQAQGTPQIWRWLLAELAIGALALAATTLLGPELRMVARAASLCALLAGLASLAAVHQGYARGTNGLFAGIGLGFFSRMVLLAVGLVATHARGDAALAYAFTFFALFVLTQGTEIAYVLSRSRSRTARAA